MIEDIKKIIADAILAPSGENSQPWKFNISNNVIKLILLPQQDQSLYNWKQSASYMANGAVIENISISAREHGYEPCITLLPDKDNLCIVASILLEKKDTKKDVLYEYISKRVTNRKPYANIDLTSDQIGKLVSSYSKEPGHEFILNTESKYKKTLGCAGSANEVVMMGNKHLHKFFFSHINWDKKEDSKKKVGFFIDTLELPLPAKIGFKIFKRWAIINILNKVNFNKLIGRQNAKIYMASSGFGIITSSNNSAVDFVLSGRMLQRVWLTATGLGLSIQPLTGVLFFMHRIMAGETSEFTSSQVDIITNAYNDIQKVFKVNNDRKILFMFRIGVGGRPTARSSRFSVDGLIENL